MVVERIGCPNNRKEFQTLMKQLTSHIVIIKCYADWCGPCKAIKNHVEESFDNMRTSDKIMVYLDVDEQDDVAAYLKIRSLPTLISYRDGMKDQVVEGSDERKITMFFRQSSRKL